VQDWAPAQPELATGALAALCVVAVLILLAYRRRRRSHSAAAGYHRLRSPPTPKAERGGAAVGLQTVDEWVTVDESGVLGARDQQTMIEGVRQQSRVAEAGRLLPVARASPARCAEVTRTAVRPRGLSWVPGTKIHTLVSGGSCQT